MTRGPFTVDKYVLNIGPGGATAYNPRCLVRDFRRDRGRNFTKPSDVLRLFESCGGSAACFFTQIDVPATGVHGSGHLQIGGVANDVFISPADPAFWLHHGMLDRVWAMWQFLGRGEERVGRVFGTETNFNGGFWEGSFSLGWFWE